MTVLVDTSVWSLLYRKDGPRRHPKVLILQQLLEQNEDVSITGSILQEILQAFRRDRQFDRVANFFRPFGIIELERTDYIAAAKLHRDCASKGVAASTIDCQIAIASIKHDCLLLTADKDFHHIAGLCQFRLL